MRTTITALSLAVASAGAAAAEPAYQTQVFVSDLEMPWAIAWLPAGDVLVTERPGRLRVVRDGTLLAEPVAGVPEVFYSSQGGLLDVEPHPDFETNKLVYLSYSAGDKSANALRVARGTYADGALENVETVFTAEPLKDTPVHFGGRIQFLPDGTMLVTIGDGFEYREKAQDLSSDLGKTVRLRDDGSAAPDNPFVGQAGARPEIYTYGHRNPQGLALDPVTGTVYEAEFGPRGGDEINILKPGANYGWPLATYGRDYSGASITPYKEYPGTEQPLVHWEPAISPSGLAVYRGDMFPEWDGDIFISGLTSFAITRVDLEGGAVAGQETLLTDLKKRIRDVAVGPDGALYAVTDDSHGDEADPGQVIRIFK